MLRTLNLETADTPVLNSENSLNAKCKLQTSPVDFFEFSNGLMMLITSFYSITVLWICLHLPLFHISAG